MDRAERAYRQWEKERPDIDGLPMMVLGRLNEVAQRVSRDHLWPLFASHGLQPGDFDVLATLRRAGPPYALSPTALYDATMVTSGTMTSRVDRLEKSGWVAREPDPDDRRGRLVALTKPGFALIDLAVTEHVDNEIGVLAGLSRKEQEALSTLLGKLIETLPTPSARQ